jgi:hypothetical protein
MEDLGNRLETNRAALAALRGAVERGEPWPLSDDYGAEPESAWGPKELLAHVAEMVPYWLGQIESVIAAPSEPVPFGRVATDAARIERIGTDRRLPASELFDRLDRAAADVRDRLRGVDATALGRRGAHVRLGEMTVEAMVQRFIVGHIEEHVRQLEEILASGRAGEADGAG